MARKRRKRAKSRTRMWPALLVIVLTAGILAATYYGITRLFAGVDPEGSLSIPGLVSVEEDYSPVIQPAADGTSAYFGSLPSDYDFRVLAPGLDAAGLAGAAGLTAEDGSTVELTATARSGGYDLSPVGGSYLPGQTYRLSLPEGVHFVAENLKSFRTLYFSTRREASSAISFQKNTVILKPDDILENKGDTLLLRGGACKAGNIIILPAGPGDDAPRALHADTAEESLDGLTVTTSEPDLSDVFRSLSLSGRFTFQIGQIDIATLQNPGVDVEDLSGGNSIKIRATFQTSGQSDGSGSKLVLVYEDQPELALDIQSDGRIAASLYSSGAVTLSWENSGPVGDDIDTLTREQLIDALQAILSQTASGHDQHITLMTAQVSADESPLAISLSLQADLAEVFRGGLSAQLTSDGVFTASTRMFHNTAVAFGSTNAQSATCSVNLFGNTQLAGAVTMKAQVSLLQFSGTELSIRRGWQVDAGGQLLAGESLWTSYPDQKEVDLTLGFLSVATDSRMTGSVTGTVISTDPDTSDLLCAEGQAAQIGPWGSSLLPAALSAPAAVQFDETQDSVALPAIEMSALNLMDNKLVFSQADPASLLFLLNRVQLFVEDGQIILPADLALGDHAVDISLDGIPDVRGVLTLTKIKPALSADLRLIRRLLSLHKADAIALMDAAYTQVAAGADGWLDGYYYAGSGLTLCFYPPGMPADPEHGITEDDLDRVQFVYCEDKTDINDARVGMSPAQIKTVLGQPLAYYPASDYFMLDVNTFIVEDLSISFAGTGDSDETQYAYIRLAPAAP